MADDTHDYDADLAPQEFKFTLNKKKYVLREAPADAGRRWRNANLAGATMKDGRVTVPDSMADSETILVQGCVKEQFGDPIRERDVTLSQIREWPDRVTRNLFERAKKMSGLDKEDEGDEGAEKKLPLDGQVTSDLPIS